MDRVAMVRNAYRRWDESKGADNAVWLSLFADNVRLRSLAGIAADWEMVHYTPERFIAQGDDLVVLCSCAWKHRRTGKVMESLKSDFFQFSGDKVVDFLELYDTAKAIDATQGATAPATGERNLAPA